MVFVSIFPRKQKQEKECDRALDQSGRRGREAAEEITIVLLTGESTFILTS